MLDLIDFLYKYSGPYGEHYSLYYLHGLWILDKGAVVWVLAKGAAFGYASYIIWKEVFK
jgi:hypothetical protein